MVYITAEKSISFTSQMMSPVLSFRTSSPWELSWPDTCNTPSRTAGTTGKVPGHMQLKAISCSLSSYLSCSCEAFLHELLLGEVLGGAPLFFITTQVLMVKVSHRAREPMGYSVFTSSMVVFSIQCMNTSHMCIVVQCPSFYLTA